MLEQYPVTGKNPAGSAIGVRSTMPTPEHREGHATLEKAPTTWSARRPRRAADSQTASQAAITYARSEPSRQNPAALLPLVENEQSEYRS